MPLSLREHFCCCFLLLIWGLGSIAMIDTETISECMSTAEIKEKAESLGINTEEKDTTELIHSIQISEGSAPCFGMSDGQCPQSVCFFRQDCLEVSLAESRKAEQHFRQQASELTAQERLQQQVVERESTEDELKQYLGQLEHRVVEESDKLVEVDDSLQRKMSESQECSKQFEQYLEDKISKLKAVKKQLQREIAKRKQTEESVVELQTKLTNVNFVIQKQLESIERGPENCRDSAFVLRSIAKLCGRICGLFAKAIQACLH